MTDTTMNTGAASLSDERERAAITACALMIKGICLTRPNAEWTGAIEDRIQFMLKQMQAGAAIAAGGAQEPAFDMLAHLQRQRDFSERTFGPGARTKGVVDHIRKELVEIEQNPGDFSEWADVVILGLDGFWRAGASPQQIIDTIIAKQTKNEGRTWPDWRTADPNKAIEHDRSGEQCPQCNGKGTVLFRDPEDAWDMTCGICKGTGAAPAASNGEQA